MTDWADDELRIKFECPRCRSLADTLLRERATYTARLALAERARDAAIERATCLDAAYRASAGVESLRQERDALAVQNDALRKAGGGVVQTMRSSVTGGCDVSAALREVDVALSLDLPRAAAIAEAAGRVCEAANEGHDHIVEIGQSDECALCDALAEWRKAKEDA